MHLRGLAEQSIHASLMIKKGNDRFMIGKLQSANDALVKHYDETDNLSKIVPLTYRITNLPRLLASVPVTSIFSYIMFVDPDGPDPRFVPVMSEKDSRDEQKYPVSTTLTPLIDESKAPAAKSPFEEFNA